MATGFGERVCDAPIAAGIPIGDASIGPITRSALGPALSPETATALLLLDGLTANELQIWLRFGKRMLDRHR